MSRPILTVGHRAIALVVRGDDIVMESGQIARGCRSVFAEGRQVARLGDSVPLQSTTGNVSHPVSKTVFAEGKQVGLLGARVTGPRILWGMVVRGCRSVFAG